ncbi:hypothetical protein AYL99_00955 [Fonsecaea erecta]|uniref:Non-structural maintenance of chromosomes element 4 n=1 Tax=Fonsecaea erecta TaxID=1367422 RepID=A0A179A0M4_9EURO|nr:hypothetical protein AYL99_00955 [Fonsecaea erecta]OAP64983.1 hypothetical protein AYL99_00955 [Fonsecaea erecta]
MAHLNTQNDRRTSTPPAHPGALDPPSASLEPHDSDSENGHHTADSIRKRKSGMASPLDRTATDPRKRRRIGDGELQSQLTQQKELDPEQLAQDREKRTEERRQVRKDLRSLFSKLSGSRSEYLRPESKGLEETLTQANAIYKNVKETSDATIDSRILVEAADLSFRKINNLILGDVTPRIDVDDFVTKCIAFMRQGHDPGTANGDAPPSTQPSSQSQSQSHRRGRRRQANEEDEGDTMNWEYLGKNACILYNARPCVTGFLLGPLSVQKKVRQQIQRRAREAPTDATRAVRPTRLGDQDQEEESANLPALCTEIARILQMAMYRGIRNARTESEEAPEPLSEAQRREIFRRNVIADNGGVPFFNFCVNPKSFGQTVENMFYVSFLVKEGKVNLGLDSDGLPTLALVKQKPLEERQEVKRSQAIFALDFDIWREIIETFEIKESMIPHRKEQNYDDGTLESAPGENDVDLGEMEPEESDA